MSPLLNLLLLCLNVAFISCRQTSVAAEGAFGHNLLPLFALDQTYTNLNHGSFGACPHSILQTQRQFELQMESSPDRWFRYDVYSAVDEARARVANYVGADEEDVVFIINASQGVNAVLRSIVLPSAAKVLYLSTAYQMVKNTLYFLRQQFEEQLIQVNLTFPIARENITSLVRAALDANPEIRLASFSHVTSIPSFILPLEDLIELCHQRGVMVLIDGAHALGQIPVNVTELNADFYLSNGHKWFYTPKGSAFLWVRKDRQPFIRPTVISDEGQGSTFFQMEFSWQGTFDYSAYLSFPAAIAFRESLGDDAIMTYMHQLAVNGGELLADMWNTEMLFEDTSMIGAMVNVRVPTLNDTLAQALPTLLLEKYNTWVPIFPLQNQWWVRVSAQIYNELSDFKMLGNAVLQLIQSS